MPALPATLKAEYDALNCDGVLKTLAAALAAADAAAPKADGPLGPRDECRAMMAKHSVSPGSSWGSLGPNGQRRWGSLRCDGLVKGAKNTPSKAAADRARKSTLPSSRQVTLETCPKSTEPLPLVAVCCGTTTRGKGGWITPRPDALEELAVFDHLLPSFVRTVDCGFRYAVVLGYDVGDKFWDLGDGATLARAWFDENVKSVLAAANVEAELRFAVVDNKIKKPGPVFTAITRHAYYEAKADYIYRVNDDTELATRWAKHFVAALATMDNVGAVGPMCKQGNRKILTHDFTHRKHMDIFEGTYYPPELSDWWMDDWISGVYGADRTLRGEVVEVVHHTGKHGQRYGVDKSSAAPASRFFFRVAALPSPGARRHACPPAGRRRGACSSPTRAAAGAPSRGPLRADVAGTRGCSRASSPAGARRSRPTSPSPTPGSRSRRGASAASGRSCAGKSTVEFLGSARRPLRVSNGGGLLELDLGAALLDLLLDVLGLVLGRALLEGDGRGLDHGLGLLEAEARDRADDLEHRDLLVRGHLREHDVELVLLLGRLGAAARRAGRRHHHARHGRGGRVDAERLLDLGDELRRLDEGEGLDVLEDVVDLRGGSAFVGLRGARGAATGGAASARDRGGSPGPENVGKKGAHLGGHRDRRRPADRGGHEGGGGGGEGEEAEHGC